MPPRRSQELVRTRTLQRGSGGLLRKRRKPERKIAVDQQLERLGFGFLQVDFWCNFNANVGLKKSIDVVETMKQNELIEVVTSGHCIFILVPLFLCFSCVTRSGVTNTRVFQDIHPMTSAEKPWWFARCCCLRVFTRRWSSTSSANDYDDFSGSVSALPSVQFFILQYGRRFSMIFSNTSQVQVTLHQQSEQKKFYPWCWKTKQKAGFLGRISRRKIWKIMFPEWWELRAACCSRLQLETYKDVAGTITIGLRGLESSIPFESQTTSDNRIPHWFLGRYRFVPKLSAPRILWWHQCSLGQWVPGIENLRNPRRRLVAWNRCIP